MSKKLKNFVNTTARTALVSTSLLVISPLQTVAAAESQTDTTAIERTVDTSTENFSSSLSSTKKLIEVDNKGHLKVKDNVDSIAYEKYDLAQLEEHFTKLNQKVDQGIITINSNLGIEKTHNGITTFASGPTEEYYWWGYKTTYTDSQTDEAISTLNSFAAGTAGAAALGAWFPVFGAGAGVTSAYASLLASRMGANNNGNGVVVDMTWAAVYNVSPR